MALESGFRREFEIVGRCVKLAYSILATCRSSIQRCAGIAVSAGALAVVFTAATPSSTQTAIANGDTRTLSFVHAHRKDSLTVTFRRNGQYDPEALRKLNHFMRDWRNDDQTRMDPRLFDVTWEAYRLSRASQPIIILSAYRSPGTNSMLRRRSRGVANNSQHMYGRAIDLRIPGVSMHRVREVAMQMQRGGVGWYPRSGFVHLDTGSVRAWPRMSYSQLARLFPDGRTVHVAADGRTLPGYEEARTMVASRSGGHAPTVAEVRQRGFLARLLGTDADEDEADQLQARRDRRRVAQRPPARTPQETAAPTAPADGNNAASFFRQDAARMAAAEPRSGAAPAATAPSARRAPAEPTAVAASPAPPPPRRPAAMQIAAATPDTDEPAIADIPLPPPRPRDLIMLAEAPARTPAGARSGIRGGLPDLITQDTDTDAASAAPSALAFAAPLSRTQPAASPQRRPTVQKVALRSNTPAAPSLARTLGLRAATRPTPASHLSAVQLNRSTFTAMIDPQPLTHTPMRRLAAPALVPLRAAARQNPTLLMFAPASDAALTLSRHRQKADLHRRLSAPAQRQAMAVPR